MSRYADKRLGAGCSSERDCPAAGTALRIVNGRVNWYCSDCAERIDKGTR